MYVYTSGNDIVVKSLDNKMLNGKVAVLNLLGQVVNTQNLNNCTSKRINAGLNTGVYVVRLSTNEGGTFSQKVILK